MPEIDIRFLLNSPEVEREAQRTRAAISGVGESSVKVGKTMSSAFAQATDEAEDLTENARIQKKVIADLERQYEELSKKVGKAAPGEAKTAMQRQLSAARRELDDEKKALRELEEAQGKYEQSVVSLSTQIEKKSDGMARVTEGAKEYRKTLLELEQLEDRMADASGRGHAFADGERNVREASDATQGAGGAMSATTGAAALLRASEVEREAQRTKAALSDVGEASAKVGKTMSAAFSLAVDDSEDLTENIRIQKQVVADLERQYKALSKKVDKAAPGEVKMTLQQQLSATRREMDDEKKALGELESAQGRYKQSVVSLRAQIRKKRDDMARMTEGTKEYRAAMIELGRLEDRMADVSRQGHIFADDERNIRATSDAIQGVSGAMSVATGTAALLGASEENLTKIQTRLQAVMAISIGVNQVAQTLNKDSYFTHIILAKAKDMLAAATTRVSVALGVTNTTAKALMATMSLGLTAAIGVVVALFDRWNKKKAETLSKNAELHGQLAKSRIEIARETEAIDKNFTALEKCKVGTKGYNKVKDSILSKYGKYLQGLNVEIQTLQNVAGAYDAIKKAAVESINVRAKAAFISDAQTIATEKMGKAIKAIRDGVASSYSKEFLEEFPDQISSIMAEVTDTLMAKGKSSRDKFFDVAAILEDYGFSPMRIRRVLQGWGPFTLDLKSSFVKDFHLALEELNGVEEVAERVFKTSTPSNEEAQKNKQYWTEQRDAAQVALEAMGDGKKGTAEWNAELKKLSAANAKLKLWDFAADPTKLQSQISQSVLQGQLELENARVAIMKEGRTKRKQEADVEYKQRLADIDKEEKELIAKYKKQGKKLPQEEKTVFENRRQVALLQKNRRDADAELDYFNQTKELYKELGDVFLTEEQRKTSAIEGRFRKMRQAVINSKLYDGMPDLVSRQLFGLIDKAEQQALLDESLLQFKSYAQRVEQTTSSFNERIARLRKAGYEEEAKEGERQRDRELQALSESMLQQSDLWVQLFDDATQKSIDRIKELIARTQNLFDYLQGKEGAAMPVGFTAGQLEQLKKSPEALKAISGAIRQLKQELGVRSPFDKFVIDVKSGVERIRKAFSPEGRGMKDIAAGATMIDEAFQSFSPVLKQFGRDLGNIFGDDVSEAVSQMTDLGGAVMSVGAGFTKLLSGDLAGGVQSIVKGIGSVFSMWSAAEKRHRQALEQIADARIAQQREYNKLLLEQNLLYKEGKGAFGTDEIGRAKNALKNYLDALAAYRAELKGDKPEMNVAERMTGDAFGTYRRRMEEYERGMAALDRASIVTGHKKTGLFGWGKGKDTYSSLLSVYPKLIDGQGKLNKEMAQSILSTRKMDDYTRNLLQSLIDMQDAAEAALAELDDYLNQTFGGLADGLLDALVTSIESGTSAWREFEKTGAQVLENLGRQIVYSLFMKESFDGLTDNLRKVFSQDKSEEQIAADAMALIDGFFGQMELKFDGAEKWLQWWKEEGKKHGFDMYEGDEGQGGAATGEIQAQITEGTASRIEGLANMIALDLRAVRELSAGHLDAVRATAPSVASIMRTTILIEQNTRATAEHTKLTAQRVAEGFEGMGRKLDAIAANTRSVQSRG